MSITSAEGIAEQIVLTATRESVRISAQIARLSVHGLATLLKTSLHLLANSRLTPQALNAHGQVRLRTLQSFGADVHAQEVSPKILRSLKTYLRMHGIDFSVENAPDGKTYVHFQGKDVDAMRHAITQALARLTPETVRETPERSNVDADSTKTLGDMQPTVETTPTHSDAPPRDQSSPTADTTQPGAAKPLSERVKTMPLRQALASRATERAAADMPTGPHVAPVKAVKR